MTALLHQLQSLEVELHHPGVRCPRDRLEELLHPDFHEVGRSGREYSRETVIEYLKSQDSQPTVASDSFVACELSPGVALLTYRSANVELGGKLGNHTLRSSLWVKESATWQLRYHQGTPAAHEW